MSLARDATIRVAGREFAVLERFSGRDGAARARDLRTGQVCCVRMRNEPMDSELAALKRASRHSRWLPRVLCSGRVAQGHCIVTSWVPGRSDLASFLRSEGAPETRAAVAQRAQWMPGLAGTLKTLHHVARIVHADIKPGNLVVSVDGDRLTLIDFGFAWRIERTAKRAGGAAGTAVYAAPELWRRGTDVGPAADQFSASVVFFQLLTGELPYEGYGGQFYEHAAPATATPLMASPHRTNRMVCRRLGEVVARGLALDAQARYPSSRSWEQALAAGARAQADRMRWRRRLFGWWRPGLPRERGST